jgi:putative salt-induced outer membrane protein YdiY
LSIDREEDMDLKYSSSLRVTMVALMAGLVLAAGMASGEEEKKKEGWSGEISASGSAQTGTVDTLSGTLDATTERNWTADLLTFRLFGTFGQTRDRQDNPSDDRTIQNSQALFTTWRRTLSDRFFWSTRSELSRDTTQDREVRVMLTSGPGYRFWRNDIDEAARHFDVSMGPGYRYELYDGNTGPGPNNEDGSDAHLADMVAAFEYKNLFFEDRIEWTHTGGIALPMNDANAFVARTEVIMGVPLTAAWSFRTTFLFEWVNDAPDDVNSALTRTTLGLGYKF